MQMLYVDRPASVLRKWADHPQSIELSRRAANEPGLQALIGVYKDFYPDVFAGVAISERAAIVSVCP